MSGRAQSGGVVPGLVRAQRGAAARSCIYLNNISILIGLMPLDYIIPSERITNWQHTWRVDFASLLPWPVVSHHA